MPLMTKVGALPRISSDHYRYMGVLGAGLKDPGVFGLGLFGVFVPPPVGCLQR